MEAHEAVVVENHLNMVMPLDGSPSISLAVVAALLNSEVVDQVFRCMSGSVAVSAYELQALPLPSPSDLNCLEFLARTPTCRNELNQTIEELYLEAMDGCYEVETDKEQSLRRISSHSSTSQQVEDRKETGLRVFRTSTLNKEPWYGVV